MIIRTHATTYFPSSLCRGMANVFTNDRILPFFWEYWLNHQLAEKQKPRYAVFATSPMMVSCPHWRIFRALGGESVDDDKSSIHSTTSSLPSHSPALEPLEGVAMTSCGVAYKGVIWLQRPPLLALRFDSLGESGRQRWLSKLACLRIALSHAVFLNIWLEGRF